MARLPDKSSRFILISVFVFCSSFLFLDFRFNTFKPIKDFYNSSSIFIKVFSKQVIFSPIYNSVSSIVNSRNIKEENEELKAELNYQLIKNYIVSNKSIVNRNIFFGEVDIEKINSVLIPSKVVSFDVNQYFCCDKHRIFLRPEIDDDVNSFKVLINSEGIIGQTIKINKNLFEAILLSDKDHIIPIQDENNFYCEAKGLGVPKKIFCDIDLTLGVNSFEENQKFLSSGLGGIFPKGVEIGNISEIKELSDREVRLIIELNADPLSSNFFGVLK